MSARALGLLNQSKQALRIASKIPDGGVSLKQSDAHEAHSFLVHLPHRANGGISRAVGRRRPRHGTTTSRRWGHGTTTRRPRLASTRPRPLEPLGSLRRCCLRLRQRQRTRSRRRLIEGLVVLVLVVVLEVIVPIDGIREPCREVARAMKRRKRLMHQKRHHADGASKQGLTVPKMRSDSSASSWTRTSTTGPLATSPFGRTTSIH